MQGKLKIAILQVLHACSGQPMPHAALISAVAMSCRHLQPTGGDIESALKTLESDGYAAGVSDDFTGRSWTLTEKGTHKARQLA